MIIRCDYNQNQWQEININLLNNFLFSKIFGEKGCEREILYLINVITGKNFKSLTFISNELKGEYKNNKKSITDVLVTTNDGTLVNVESQIAKQKNFHKRSHFYNSRICSILLRVGQSYEELPMTIIINILNFTLHKEIEDYHTKFTLTENKEKNYSIPDLMETHYIELTKLRKLVREDNIDLNDPKTRLILFLDEKTPKKLIKKVIKMDEFGKNIYEKSAHILQDQEEYLAYIRAEQTELDTKAMIDCGKEEGEEKGIKKGIEKGKIEVAIKLKELNLPIEQIAEATGITPAKIKKL